MRRPFYLISLGIVVIVLAVCPTKQVRAQGSTIVTPAGPSASGSMDGLSPNPGTFNMSPVTPGVATSQNYSSPFETEYAQPNAMNAIDTPPGVMPRVDDLNRPNSNTGQNEVNTPGSRGAGLSPF